MEEKIYTFEEHDGTHENIIHVRESELTKPQRDLILGGLIKEYQDSPKSVQNEFIVWALKQPTEILC